MNEQQDIANVLIVDNDPELARLMLEILARKGIRGHLVGRKEKALDFIGRSSCDFVFISETINPRQDLPDRSQDGFELLGKLRDNWPELPVVMIGDPISQGPHFAKRLRNGNPQKNGEMGTLAEAQKSGRQNLILRTAVKAVLRGCCDFLTRPPDTEKIEILLDTYLPNHSVSTSASANEDTHCLYRIVGKSATLRQVIELAKKIAPTTAPVLINGESGTGKELIAYLIHHRSKRSQAAFIKVNCAALSDSLLESELFGHEKGAFTGAYTQRKGRFEMAHGGTLLLDEIAETPIRFQAKLLRVLEQQDFERVGGNESVSVDVRIISTTNKDLLREVQLGRFRQDLYYRLSGARLVLSPLRERKDDLSDLVWYFINIYAREVPRRITQLDSVMMDIFSKYHWPGNIRQLRNVVRTSLTLGVGPILSLADVSWLFDELQPLPQEQYSDYGSSGMQNDSGLAGMPLEQVEKRAILDTLRQTGGNQTKAAKVLGISDRTLRDRIHRYREEGCLQPA
jgi:DNA-binding NtrC family response regulator